jgi:hypothetical protein
MRNRYSLVCSRSVPKTVRAACRGEAARLGYGSNELGASPLEVELADLLAPYVKAVEADPAA